jgi:predicted metalloendopeptidase
VDSDLVSVSDLAYLVNVTTVLQSTSARTIRNYLIWRFMMNRASNLPRRFRQTREQFDRVFKGNSAEPTRATSCAKYINDNMGFAVTRLYVENYFDDNARNQSKEILKNVRNSMINLLQNASWMDDESKAKAVEKVVSFLRRISRLWMRQYLGIGDL